VRQDEEKYVSIQGEHSHMKTAARLDGNDKKSMFLIVVYATYVECVTLYFFATVFYFLSLLLKTKQKYQVLYHEVKETFNLWWPLKRFRFTPELMSDLYK